MGVEELDFGDEQWQLFFGVQSECFEEQYRDWLANGHDYHAAPTYATIGEWLGDWLVNYETKSIAESGYYQDLEQEARKRLGLDDDEEIDSGDFDDVLFRYEDFVTGDETRAGIVRMDDGKLMSTDEFFDYCMNNYGSARARKRRKAREQKCRNRVGESVVAGQ